MKIRNYIAGAALGLMTLSASYTADAYSFQNKDSSQEYQIHVFKSAADAKKFINGLEGVKIVAPVAAGVAAAAVDAGVAAAGTAAGTVTAGTATAAAVAALPVIGSAVIAASEAPITSLGNLLAAAATHRIAHYDLSPGEAGAWNYKEILSKYGSTLIRKADNTANGYPAIYVLAFQKMSDGAMKTIYSDYEYVNSLIYIKGSSWGRQ